MKSWQAAGWNCKQCGTHQSDESGDEVSWCVECGRGHYFADGDVYALIEYDADGYAEKEGGYITCPNCGGNSRAILHKHRDTEHWEASGYRCETCYRFYYRGYNGKLDYVY